MATAKEEYVAENVFKDMQPGADPQMLDDIWTSIQENKDKWILIAQAAITRADEWETLYGS